MKCLRAAFSLAGFFAGLLALTSTSFSLPLPVSNASTNSVLVVTSAGPAFVAAATSVEWWSDENTSATVYTNGVSAATWTSGHGHAYSVFCGPDGVTVLDRSSSATAWFFAGLSLSVVFGLVAILFRAMMNTAVGGGGFNE